MCLYIEFNSQIRLLSADKFCNLMSFDDFRRHFFGLDDLKYHMALRRRRDYLWSLANIAIGLLSRSKLSIQMLCTYTTSDRKQHRVDLYKNLAYAVESPIHGYVRPCSTISWITIPKNVKKDKITV